MDNTTLFAVGSVIFVIYMGSYLAMVSHQNRIQKEGPAKPTVKQSEPDLGKGKSA
jgi:ABC-type sugar transport system permease subunit